MAGKTDLSLTRAIPERFRDDYCIYYKALCKCPVYFTLLILDIRLRCTALNSCRYEHNFIAGYVTLVLKFLVTREMSSRIDMQTHAWQELTITLG